MVVVHFVGDASGGQLFLQRVGEQVAPYSEAADELLTKDATSDPRGDELVLHPGGIVDFYSQNGFTQAVFYAHPPKSAGTHVVGNWYSLSH